MKQFTQLYIELDATTSQLAKTKALANYLRKVDPLSGAWAVNLLSGQRIKRTVTGKKMREWLASFTDLPPWLIEDCYANVGDLAETMALLIPVTARHQETDVALGTFIESTILPLREADETTQAAQLHTLWRQLPSNELFILHKLLTGGFRVGVSRKTVAKAIAQAFALPEALVTHRLMAFKEPSEQAFLSLTAAEEEQASLPPSTPYPFCLAYPLDIPPTDLGSVQDWQVEFKWDGIRGQLIKREGEVYLWSRGEELINHQFPDICDCAQKLPDGTVIDGEIVVMGPDGPKPFAELQTRLGRKKPGPKILAQSPAGFIAYDIIESAGVDCRDLQLRDRRDLLEQTLTQSDMFVSPVHRFKTWQEVIDLRQQCQATGIEGLMIKHLDSQYQDGRKKGQWWKWKVDPMTLDGVLLYAQAGHGRRANLYTDYTLGIWRGDELVPIAKAYSGLTDQELVAIDRWIKQNTLERFGPVRKVPAEIVLEIAFEGIASSKRHKSGFALRFPRIARWRQDKTPRDADSVDTVTVLLDNQSNRLSNFPLAELWGNERPPL